MRPFSKRAALKAMLAAPLAALFLRAKSAQAIPASKIDAIYDELGTYTWAGSIQMDYKPNSQTRGLEVNLRIEDMTFKVDQDWKVKGGLMMWSVYAGPDGKRADCWARFDFDGYMVNSEKEDFLVQLVIEHMDLSQWYSRFNKYPFAGTEEERMFFAGQPDNFAWPNCNGTLWLGYDQTAKVPFLYSNDRAHPGEFSLQQFGTQFPVSMIVSVKQ